MALIFELYPTLQYPPVVYKKADAATMMSPNCSGEAFIKIMNDFKVLGFTLALSNDNPHITGETLKFCQHMNDAANEKLGVLAFNLFFEGAQQACIDYDIDPDSLFIEDEDDD